MKNLISWRYVGIPLGLFSIALFFFLKQNVYFAEGLYNSFYNDYQQIRSILVLIPGSYLFYLPGFFILIAVVFLVFELIKKKTTSLSFFLSLISIIGFAVFYFYTFWGYNYARPSFQQRVDLELKSPDYDEIFENLSYSINQLNTYRDALNLKDTLAWYDDSFSKEMQEDLSLNVKELVNNYGYKTNFKTYVNELKPKGVLRRFGSAGMFLPWSGEAYYDAGVPTISRPNTFAHELAHVCGVTNEGESNFIAYQAGINSNNNLVKYSVAHSYHRYAASVAFKADSTRYNQMISQLDSLVLADMISRKKCGELYPDFFPKTRDKIYNQYLKTQGVSSGIDDYSKLYLLANAWRAQNN